MILLLFGPPGAGKGTQSSLLVERLNMKHVSTGDLFRNAIKNQTELGKKAKSYMDQGNLVPDEVTIGLVEEVLAGAQNQDIILDGFPRTAVQADALEKLLRTKNSPLDKALFLSVDEKALVTRLSGRRVCKDCGESYHIAYLKPKVEGKCDKCGGSNIYQRPDDAESAIQTRLDVYKTSTSPLVDFYKSKGLFVEVSGEGSTEEVFGRLKTEILKLKS